MKAVDVAVRASSPAAPSDVFALLKDGSTWPRWSMFKAFELERAGDTDPLGVGAIRVFVSASRRAREEVVEMVEGRQLSYVLRSGMPFRGYRADVILSPRLEGGTQILWRAHFEVCRPGTGWFWKLVMWRVLGMTARQLADAATNSSVLRAAQANLDASREPSKASIAAV